MYKLPYVHKTHLSPLLNIAAAAVLDIFGVVALEQFVVAQAQIVARDARFEAEHGPRIV